MLGDWQDKLSSRILDDQNRGDVSHSKGQQEYLEFGTSSAYVEAAGLEGNRGDSSHFVFLLAAYVWCRLVIYDDVCRQGRNWYFGQYPALHSVEVSCGILWHDIELDNGAFERIASGPDGSLWD